MWFFRWRQILFFQFTAAFGLFTIRFLIVLSANSFLLRSSRMVIDSQNVLKLIFRACVLFRQLGYIFGVARLDYWCAIFLNPLLENLNSVHTRLRIPFVTFLKWLSLLILTSFLLWVLLDGCMIRQGAEFEKELIFGFWAVAELMLIFDGKMMHKIANFSGGWLLLILLLLNSLNMVRGYVLVNNDSILLDIILPFFHAFSSANILFLVQRYLHIFRLVFVFREVEILFFLFTYIRWA